ncbi:hypothetical protein ACFGVS_03110 [Mucilaginibacter sp. AW1-7]|uniref:hypothetical protein n=1 Tax=Mucilaginibacter sp. AW1-7 TaxID=3349874 RepID=UPI003F7415B3
MLNNLTWNGSSFWHGTSTIFLDSIRATGLGAINPSTDWKLIDLLKFLYAEIRHWDISHPSLDINRASIEASIAQGDLEYHGLTLNYRHEGIYVSASQMRAAYYACMNTVGSEILEKCLILISVLIHAGREPDIPAELDVLDIRRYLAISAKPVMIEVNGVSDVDLILENGKEAGQLLQKLRNEFPALPIPEQFERLQYCNFRLLNPIPVADLKFYEVDFEGNPRNRNFQYYLSRI